jgi:predicted RNA-binding protein with PUA-like domain
MRHWLVKSEPTTYSIDHLRSDKRTLWDGVRNYQARNYLREMKKGDLVLFYHSVTEPVGIAGIAKVAAEAKPDPTQFDRKSKHFDSGSKSDNPRWFSPELAFVRRFEEVLSRDVLAADKRLRDMVILKRGSRLSVTPVTPDEFEAVCDLWGGTLPAR